ncbi:MAG: tetratricopeptide repeat protein [Aggregatilineales bacterium]
MHSKLRYPILFSVLILFFGIFSAQAQESTIELSPAETLGIPPAIRLPNLTMQHQDLNRCSAAALTIQLSYFNTGDYQEIIHLLNPYGGDVSVRVEEMIRVAEYYGLKALVRRGGTIDLLRQVVAAGFPVLLENAYQDGEDAYRDWMSHNRVLMGYDDRLQQFYFFDPLLGAGDDGRGRAMSYVDVDMLWRQFNRDYVIVYREFDEGRLLDILGEQYQPDFNAQWSLVQAQFDIYGDTPDAFAYLNRGWAQVELGQYTEAVEAFDAALDIGIPARMLWYEFGLFEAYLAAGRYDDVLTQGRRVLLMTEGVEEIYYYMGRAHDAMGDTAQAIEFYESAILRNRYYTEAQEALAALQPETGANG